MSRWSWCTIKLSVSSWRTWPVPGSTELLLFRGTLVTPHNEPFYILPSSLFSTLCSQCCREKLRCYNTAPASTVCSSEVFLSLGAKTPRENKTESYCECFFPAGFRIKVGLALNKELTHLTVILHIAGLPDGKWNFQYAKKDPIKQNWMVLRFKWSCSFRSAMWWCQWKSPTKINVDSCNLTLKRLLG